VTVHSIETEGLGVTEIDILRNRFAQNWTIADIPSQTGTQAVITGGSSGLGYQTALALARAGGDVILAGRDGAMAREALASIRQLAPGVLVRFERLDLANLESVADFAVRMAARDYPIDLLVNNAGIPEAAERRVTADGFEMQLGVNYLGHYALTAHLLPLLRRSRRPRVVQVSSLVHRQGSIQFDNLQMERGYNARAAHSRSKLASLMFALELQNRSDQKGWRLFSTAAHPGYVRPGYVLTEPTWTGSAMLRSSSIGGKERKHPLTVGQTASDGALPTLFAATAPHARPGGFYGPTGRFELAGTPGPARINDKARDPEVARRLWDISESLTGVRWPAE
jgi:NAD(P)-dependent dehydrogenase (short-subunit alcohol dehydrogenase family)